MLDKTGVLHSGPATFFGLEHVVRPEAPARMAIVGVPWDEGNGGRNGANYGPRGVRDASSWFSGYDLRGEREVWDAIAAVDGGDVPCSPADAAGTIGEISSHVEDLAKRGIRPFLVGGNHAITIGAASGAARACEGPMGYLSIDTHLDTASNWNGSWFSSGCPTYRAAENTNVDPANVVVYGVHGWLNPKSQVEAAADLGIRWYGRPEIRERGLDATFAEALARASAGVTGLYVTFDMDCMDSSCAPGCGTPEPGGFLADEAIEIARQIGRALPIALDIVEIAPAYDPAGATSRLACRLMMEMVGGIADAESAGA